MEKLVNLVGQKFGKLTVIEKPNIKKGRAVVWRCRCDCGNFKNVTTSHLKGGEVRSCGCLRKNRNDPAIEKTENIQIGDKFDKLTVVSDQNTKTKLYECRCDCGSKEIVLRTRYQLIYRKHNSCTECSTLYNKLKNLQKTKTPEYKCWAGMRYRCSCPQAHEYNNYGGRGIIVCQRWENNFENFLKDMGARPGPEYTIDRINPDGNYEPNNCRWAKSDIQVQNSRVAKLNNDAVQDIRKEFEDNFQKYKTYKDFYQSMAKKYNVKIDTIRYVIKNKTWKNIK